MIRKLCIFKDLSLTIDREREMERTRDRESEGEGGQRWERRSRAQSREEEEKRVIWECPTGVNEGSHGWLCKEQGGMCI